MMRLRLLTACAVPALILGVAAPAYAQDAPVSTDSMAQDENQSDHRDGAGTLTGAIRCAARGFGSQL